MERLTVPDVRVDEHTTRRSIIDGNAVREHAMEIYWRLKDYEDTGMTPEVFQSYVVFLQDLIGKQKASEALDRFRWLAEADKDGRVAVLPVGTGGAMLDTSYPENPRLIKRVHFAVAYVSKGIVFHQPYNIFLENIAAGYISPVSEETEKALEAMTDG